MSELPKVRTCLWFPQDGLEAAKFYVSLPPDSHIDEGAQEGDLVVSFTLAGTPYMILNGGPYYRLSEAASIYVATDDQDETDRLWKALLRNGGEDNLCGWMNDRWGVSWQIIPRALTRMLASGDRAAVERVVRAMRTMRKIDIAGIEKAFQSA